MNSNTELIIYTTDDGVTKVEATFDGDTVWLSQEQMGELFQRDKSTISRHIRNIFTEGELDEKVVVAEIATTSPHGAMKGKTQNNITRVYNLDVIISVGYRVKSLRGTQFRIWATGILKEYMQQVSIIIRRHRNQSGFLRLFKINCILQLTDIQLQKLYMIVLMQKIRLLY